MAAPDPRPEAADEILIVLTRAAPGAVERDEILAEVGLGSDEIRDGLEYLEKEGEITETQSGSFKYQEEGSRPAAEPHEPGDRIAAALGANHADADEPPGPALDAHVRSTFEVVCSFRRVAGEGDEVALQKSQAISIEIGNALAMAYPRLEWHVELAGVEAYDKPRSLWPPSDEGG
jgi:hypothetical protein